MRALRSRRFNNLYNALKNEKTSMHVHNDSTIIYGIFGTLLFMYGITGYLIDFPSLGVSILLSTVLIILTVLKRQTWNIFIIDVWIFAFIYLYFSEYLLTRSEVIQTFGRTVENSSEGFISAAFGSSLVGYRFSVSRISKMSIRRGKHSGTADSAKRRKLRLPYFLALLLIAVGSLVYLSSVGGSLLSGGRADFYDSARSLGLFQSFGRAATTTLPAVALYMLRNFKIPLILRLFFIPVSILCIIATFSGGTRFHLGFLMSGLLFFSLNGFRYVPRKALMILVIFFCLAILGQGVMRSTRSAGLSNFSFENVFEEVTNIDRLMSAEGLLLWNAWVHRSETYKIKFKPLESLFIFYWWIPRDLWPEKPSMAGKWIIEESTTRYGAGHSVALGFSGPALLDFGPIKGAVFCLVFGTLIAIFEAFVRRHQDCTEPASILAGILYFGVFFMMRSPETSLIQVMIVFVTIIIPLFLAKQLTINQRHRIYINTVDAGKSDESWKDARGATVPRYVKGY